MSAVAKHLAWRIRKGLTTQAKYDAWHAARPAPAPDGMRTCSRCGDSFRLADGEHGRRICQRCRTTQVTAASVVAKARQPEKYRALRDARYQSRRIEIADAYRLRMFGISPEDMRRMFENQEGLCGICSVLMLYRGRALRSVTVDHDHRCCPGRGSCGKCIRGLICRSCNVGVGHMRDSVVVLQNAIGYLCAHPHTTLEAC